MAAWPSFNSLCSASICLTCSFRFLFLHFDANRQVADLFFPPFQDGDPVLQVGLQVPVVSMQYLAFPAGLLQLGFAGLQAVCRFAQLFLGLLQGSGHVLIGFLLQLEGQFQSIDEVFLGLEGILRHDLLFQVLFLRRLKPGQGQKADEQEITYDEK